ncbi:hypothetical protein Tco_1128342 [Tanacetum coccineum]
MLVIKRFSERKKVFRERKKTGKIPEKRTETFTTSATVRARRYDELTDAKKIREACDIKATNIVLQCSPQDIYNLVNHHEEAKHIWDRVKLLIEGVSKIAELTQQIRQRLSVCSMLKEGHMAKTVYSNLNTGLGVQHGQAFQEIPTLAAFQTDDLDAFDSDCDEAPSASAVLMANFCLYDSAAPSDVPTHDTYLDNQIIDQSVKEMQYFERLIFTDTDIDITNDSNMISYEQYLKETKNAVVQDTSPSAQQEAMIMSVIEEITYQVEVDKENKIINESLIVELKRYKEQIIFI